MKENPFAFQPNYLAQLWFKLSDRDSIKPRTGGKQMSIRMDFALQQHIDMLEEETGWNRTEIVNALVQAGLKSLYNLLSEEKTDQLTKKLALPLEADVRV